MGPIRVVGGDGEPVRVRSRKQRLMLAALLLAANRPVAVDRLIDLLWLSDPPRTARGVIHNHVSGLRALLRGEAEMSIRRETCSYALACELSRVDVFRFRALLDAPSANPIARLADLDDALGMVRGPALGGLVEDDQAWMSLGGSIDEDVLLAREERVELLLRLRPPQTVLPQILQLVAEHPHRPRLLAAQMTCLQVMGRDAEALEAYDAFRRRLSEGFGIDPPEMLRVIHVRILRGEPVLADRFAVCSGRSSEASLRPLPATA